MCGVFATTRPDLWGAHMTALAAAMHHRGPDGGGAWNSEDGAVTLCHSRLSIIGLGSEGAQPLVRPGGQALTYNGEVYNYRGLSFGLDGLAARSDTQTILQLIERDGLVALQRLRGMYALAHWDPATRRLSGVRDPWGIKPLYLLDHPGGGVSLCSEITPLLLLPEARRVDRIGLANYVAFGHSGPMLTCYQHIRKLAPGVVYSWTVDETGSTDLTTHRIEQARPAQLVSLEVAVQDSVRAHLVADVEVGVFLSGGVDSTLIAAVARQWVPDLRAFTIAFPELRAIDESALARANAAALGIRHETFEVRAADMVASLELFLRGSGEPFGDAAALPLTALSMHVGRQMKVVLTGEGADEMLGGYGRYRISRWLPRHPTPGVARLGEWLADNVSDRRSDRPRGRALEALLRSGGARSHGSLLGMELHALETHSDVGTQVDRLLRTDWEALIGGARGREAARRFDLFRWLPNVYLEKTDRATMAGGLEARTPFLDPAVALSAEAPGREFGKGALVAELRRLCPNVSLPDRKKGLAVPVNLLLGAGLQQDLDRALRSEHSLLAKLYGRECVDAFSVRVKRSPTMAYRLAVLGRWEANFDVRT